MDDGFRLFEDLVLLAIDCPLGEIGGPMELDGTDGTTVLLETDGLK